MRKKQSISQHYLLDHLPLPIYFHFAYPFIFSCLPWLFFPFQLPEGWLYSAVRKVRGQLRLSPTLAQPCSQLSTEYHNTITMPLNPKTGKQREVTKEKRVRIIERRGEGKTYCQIVGEVGLWKSEISRIWKGWKTESKLHAAHDSGRPQKLNIRDICHLRQLVDKDPSASLSEITVRSGLNVTPWTAGRYLRKEEYWVRIARTKPYLDSRKMRKRYHIPGVYGGGHL